MVPSRNPCMTRLRTVWARSPWIAATPGTRAAKRLGQPIGPALGPGEDDALAGLVAFEQMDQQVELAS